MKKIIMKNSIQSFLRFLKDNVEDIEENSAIIRHGCSIPVDISILENVNRDITTSSIYNVHLSKWEISFQLDGTVFVFYSNVPFN